jgi:large subunit ribosomal protein L22
MNEVIATAKSVRGTPRKVRMVAFSVRGMNVPYALAALQYMPKRAARDVWKVVKSAAANAEHNYSMNPEKMIIRDIAVDPAPTYKRGRPTSRGRYKQILKRNSHIRVVLVDPTAKADAAAAKKPTKATKAAKAPKVVTTPEAVEAAEVKATKSARADVSKVNKGNARGGAAVKTQRMRQKSGSR